MDKVHPRYLQPATSQSQSTVYIGKSSDLKNWNRSNAPDEVDYYAVHRVLDGSERLYLKLEDDTREIRRRQI